MMKRQENEKAKTTKKPTGLFKQHDTNKPETVYKVTYNFPFDTKARQILLLGNKKVLRQKFSNFYWT
jgi:hypothetical protein